MDIGERSREQLLDELVAMTRARDKLADFADKWIGERDEARQQLRGAVEALRKIRDKARLAEKDPGGAMAASWVEHVADDALTDLGGQ